MLRELRDYKRPSNLGEALELLQLPGVKVVALAGGTELLARRDTTIEVVVDLQDLGLDYIRASDDGLHIGATTPLQSLATHAQQLQVAGGIVAHGAKISAQFTERHAATVGGGVAVGGPAHDLLVALLACDALVELQSVRERKLVALQDVLKARERYLATGVLVTEVVISMQPQSARFELCRVARTARDHAIVNLALRVVADGVFHDVRVAAGGVSGYAHRLPAVEALLAGRASPAGIPGSIEEVARGSVDPPTDHIATSAYRRAMIGVLTRRAVQQATAQ